MNVAFVPSGEMEGDTSEVKSASLVRRSGAPVVASCWVGSEGTVALKTRKVELSLPDSKTSLSPSDEMEGAPS